MIYGKSQDASRKTQENRPNSRDRENRLENLVPDFELSKKIFTGKFQDSALVWDYKIGRWTNRFRVRKRELFDTPICPAPTLEEIMQELGKDFFVPTLSMQGAVWQVKCEFVDVLDDYRTEIKTIIDSRASTAALKLWLELNDGNGQVVPDGQGKDGEE